MPRWVVLRVGVWWGWGVEGAGGGGGNFWVDGVVGWIGIRGWWWMVVERFLWAILRMRPHAELGCVSWGDEGIASGGAVGGAR